MLVVVALPPPDPERVARAWELHAEHGKSLRAIGEILGVSHETARQWVRQGRAANSWLEENAQHENYTGPEHVRAKFAAFLDSLIAMGREEIEAGAGTYKDNAPIMLRAAIEQARALGGYAPLRIEGVPGPATPDPQTAAVVKAMEARAAAREQELRSSGGTES